VAADAAGVHDAVEEVIGLVRARRFVRTGIRDGREVVETIHDRIREMILAQLSPKAIREHHKQLAGVLEAAADSDPEAVATHLLAAGERQRSAHYAQLAAEKAVTKLAFDRAIHLYKLTLESVRPTSPEAQRLRIRLAETLGFAGRGSEAARAYLAAGEHATDTDRVELERAAAEHLLTSGRIDEGTIVLHRVLAAIGTRAPKSAASALLWLGFYRVCLFFMGLKFVERAPGEVRREDRVRIDALYSVSLGFALVDTVLGACMQARHLMWALRAGDSSQIVRAASLEATNLASVGGPETKRQRALFEMARSLAERSGDAEGKAFVSGTRGIAKFLRGQFREARELLDEAYTHLSGQRRSGWQANAELFGVEALSLTGKLHDASLRHHRLLVEAEERGDLYTLVTLRTRVAVALALAADDPDAARRSLLEAMTKWSQKGYLVQHWQAMYYEGEIELYVGNGGRAYERVHRDQRALRGSILLRAHVVRVFTAYLRGRCAVASIPSAPGQRRARIAEARRAARELSRERGAPWAHALGSIVRASAAIESGDRVGAIAALRQALDECVRADLALHASAVRVQLGAAVGGDEGVALLEQGTEAMAAQGVRVPSRMADRLVPGGWSSARPSAT
jgi:tetratricopeptide (TPR) repeat protein